MTKLKVGFFKMYKWLKRHGNWIFSGIGVTILGIFLNALLGINEKYNGKQQSINTGEKSTILQFEGSTGNISINSPSSISDSNDEVLNLELVNIVVTEEKKIINEKLDCNKLPCTKLDLFVSNTGNITTNLYSISVEPIGEIGMRCDMRVDISGKYILDLSYGSDQIDVFHKIKPNDSDRIELVVQRRNTCGFVENKFLLKLHYNNERFMEIPIDAINMKLIE